MKVLFAVSNDNITTSVVNKYQQEFKEIITSKNVYYFNAIIKELQKDKTYDAVVIGEDLEPISNSNYDAVDKFLIDKLDSISDEASKPTGEDIPIIFICSDRRTKADQLLKKLFSMSIYNALVENDRSINMVCNLINKPRNKKEAKRYYKIDSDNIEYEPGNEEDVSEAQIQNILSYYKKIGTNEKKCVQAFQSITKQYDDTQLRIIVRFLPMEIKAILEANSPEYQKLMINGTVLSNGKYNKYKQNDVRKPNKLDFLEKDLEKPKLTKPVIIPSTMKVNNIQPEIKSNDEQSVRYVQHTVNNQVQQYAQPIVNNQAQQYVEDANIQYNKQLENTNNKTQDETVNNFNNMNYEGEKLNNNNLLDTNTSENKIAQPTLVQSVKRGRGRPRKISTENESIEYQDQNEMKKMEPMSNEIKKGRGRPKKTISSESNEIAKEEVLEQNKTNLVEKSNFTEPLNLFDLDIENTNQTNNMNNNLQPNPYTQPAIEQPNPYAQPAIEQPNPYAQPVMEQLNPYVQPTMEQQNPYTQPVSSINDNIQYNNYGMMNDLETTRPMVNNDNSNINNTAIVGNGKVVAFVGTTKNGTSFIVNNLAQLLSQSGIKTAIIDLTRNKNAYYMFTDNDPQLMKIATESMQSLSKGIVKGIEVNKNLSVFTALPEGIPEEYNADAIIKNVSNNYEIVLLDCDFSTNSAYFVNSNEIYLVQTMDAFTIQPLTEFLSTLKLKNLLDETKLRVVINKYVKLKRLDDRMIIGGMSKYNEPSMTLQRDLFNPNTIKHINIPFEEQTYARYLESIAMCQLSLSGYSQNLLSSLEQLKNMVYPLIAGNSKKNSDNNNSYGNYSNSKKGLFGNKKDSTKFSNNINDTLNKMRTNNY